MAIFTYTNGLTFLTVNTAAGGANFVFTNPDGTFTTIFLTTAQTRQLGMSVGTLLATGFVNATVGTITVSAYSTGNTGTPPSPINTVYVIAPGSGTAAGINLTVSLPLR